MQKQRKRDQHVSERRSDTDTRSLLAAVAREQLARGQSITPRALAALASLSEQEVLDLIAVGTLRALRLASGEQRIEPDEAARWLAQAR